jgi:hypothetical protein
MLNLVVNILPVHSSLSAQISMNANVAQDGTASLIELSKNAEIILRFSVFNDE